MKLQKILFHLLLVIVLTVIPSFGQGGEEFQDKTKYPDIVAPSKDPAIQKLYERLKLFDCVSGSDFGTTYDSVDTAAVKNFQKANGLDTTGEVHADTWKALSLTNWGSVTSGATTSKKCSTPITTNTNISSSTNQVAEDYYVNVSSFDGSDVKTPFSNTSTGGMSKPFNFLLTLMAIAIVVLVIFRVLQGAVIKGTFDNIYNQMKGKSMISNAGKALLVFILVYAVLTFINPDLVNWTLDTSYKADLSNSPYNNGGGACPSDPYGGKSLREMIIFNEYQKGKNWIYPDTQNKMSIGVGFNLERSGAKDSLKAVNVPDDKINQLMTAVAAKKEDKNVTLDETLIFKLLDKDIADKKIEAENYFKKDGIDFKSLPENVQNVILDMMFNIGVGGFDKFTEMKKGIKAKDWAKAAKEIINSTYCSQVKSRCYRNAALMSPGCGGALNNNTSGTSLASQNIGGGDRLKNAKILAENSLTTACPTGDEEMLVTTNYSNNGINKPKIKICKLTWIKGDLVSKPENPGYNNGGAWVNSVVAQKFEDLGKAYYDSHNGKYLVSNSSLRKSDASGTNAASPGTSPHMLGGAIDFNQAGADRGFPGAKKGATCTTRKIMSNLPVYMWLKDNAPKFGIRQIPSESWHFEGIQISKVNCD